MKATHIIAVIAIVALTFIAFVALKPESKTLEMKLLSYLSISIQK